MPLICNYLNSNGIFGSLEGEREYYFPFFCLDPQELRKKENGEKELVLFDSSLLIYFISLVLN